MSEDKKPEKQFDLNIEKILDGWEVFHALREIIANALDEQVLTSTEEVKICIDPDGKWHIRDYGRGLRYEHLTQNENQEKLASVRTIGKFGIGLKDALATFDRHGIKVLIKSKYGDITLGTIKKHGFDNVMTLHAFISEPSEPNFTGTEFILDGVGEEDIRKAKDLFLKFSGETTLDETKYGKILMKKQGTGRIYINGLKVADEENFLFSYDITSISEKIRKALNRERSNVGRTAYSDRVRNILILTENSEIAKLLSEDLKNYDTGKTHDELKWIDVQEHAVKILNSSEKVVFLTPSEMITETSMVDEAKSAGYRIVTIPDNLRQRIENQLDIRGEPIRDLSRFADEYNESFEYEFVEYSNLTNTEKKVFDETGRIFALIGGRPKMIREIKISETMRKELNSFREALGLWEPKTGIIIIKRNTLSSLGQFSGTLLHEVGHAISDADDVSRAFELALSDLLGKVVEESLRNKGTKL